MGDPRPVTVYDHPLSPYGQKVKIALMEKGVAFEAPLPGNIGSGNTGGEFARVSPRGEVPALVDGDVAVFDSTIILEYIGSSLAGTTGWRGSSATVPGSMVMPSVGATFRSHRSSTAPPVSVTGRLRARGSRNGTRASTRVRVSQRARKRRLPWASTAPRSASRRCARPWSRVCSSASTATTGSSG